METTLKSYNNYHDVHGGSGGVKSREVNGRLVLEGVLRLYWGVHSAIQLKEDDDQRLPSNLDSKTPKGVVSSGLNFQVKYYISLHFLFNFDSMLIISFFVFRMLKFLQLKSQKVMMMMMMIYRRILKLH